ncbi:beta-lactamase family protein [Aquimarina sp. ERC-38]|uniref:serine hydrolase domain-containing protein n=1 Tax=Aquimarina sp. ERC-38 TaxID=2949996 RepID=UPI002246EB10|nr:serine hydrolase domain-containing protein [Aquimarina sp. ERC-38]UZO82557.1 beta-lactamase family protein [Aquimarina sp. ERC-38]
MLFRFLTLFTAIIFTNCARPIVLKTDYQNPEKTFKELLQLEINNSKGKLSGVSMTVIASNLDINWSGAYGFDSTEKDHLLSAQQPFRVASITKTFVSVAILRLHENNKLSIDDPIADYISEEHQSILKADGYAPNQITIRHCLQHISGLFDYAEGNRDYIKEAKKNPRKRWTRTEQLQFAMDHGDPLGEPGTVYGYSDTGYILLGEIIEKVNNSTLAQGLRNLLSFEDLQLKDTWLESLEPRPKEALPEVHRYFDNIDATLWDNSIDLYGGGGLYATTQDLAKFYHALFNHKIFREKETLSLMLSPNPITPEGKSNEDSRMGIGKITTEKSKIVIYLHTGFWNTTVVHIPKYNASIAVNYTNKDSNNVLSGTLQIIKRLSEKNAIR